MLVYLFRHSDILLEGTDSNRRTRKGADLQSAGFNHSPTFQGCDVDGVRTTWHKFFQDSALPWECHMGIPPELLHQIVPRVGLEPTHTRHWFLRPACLPFHHLGNFFHQHFKDLRGVIPVSTLQRYNKYSNFQTRDYIFFNVYF